MTFVAHPFCLQKRLGIKKFRGSIFVYAYSLPGPGGLSLVELDGYGEDISVKGTFPIFSLSKDISSISHDDRLGAPK